MKAIPFAVALSAVASLSFTPASFAFVCPDGAPSGILAPATDVARSCQNAIAKAAAGFVKTQLKTDTKCMSQQIPGACPSTKDTEKVQKAALKARDAVVKACDDAGALTGLTSSYNAPGVDAETAASCTLSQNNVEGRLLAFKVNGTPAVLSTNKDRAKCVKTLNSAGGKYALSVLQAINKCLASNIKAGTAGDLGPICVGKYSGGVFTPPTDQKTTDSVGKALTKMRTSVDKDCTPVNTNLRRTIFACPGAATIDDFQGCLACGTWNSTLGILAAQYSETGTVVANGAGAIQSAVNASGLNAKLLIESGLYNEVVSITDNSTHEGLQLIGCGGASGDRPKLQPPTSGGPYPNGISTANVDGLVFQSLEASGGWSSNGIFVTGAEGVTFRDVITDGNDLSGTDNEVTTYGIFPVQSSDVLVELSTATNIRDAGIYVGQCVDMTVRYNTATDNVAGIEIENSTNASVYGNYAANNVGGLLVFKLEGPEVQRGNLHDVFFNVVENNNVSPNFGIPGTTVADIPPGSGMIVLSVRDCDFHHNLVTNNGSYGFAVIDQVAFGALGGGGTDYSHTCAAPDPPFTKCDPLDPSAACPLSVSCVQDQKLEGNSFQSNNVTDNGNGTVPPSGAISPTDLVYAVFEENPGPTFNNNCFEGNGSPVVSLGGTPLGNCP